MLSETLVRDVVREVVRQLAAHKSGSLPSASVVRPPPGADSPAPEEPLRLLPPQERGKTAPPFAQNPKAMLRLMGSTPARIGIGHTGPRLRTETLLTLRGDHALARDAAMKDVDPTLLEELNLWSVQTLCTKRDQHLTRPDLGRRFSEETLAEIKGKCIPKPQVQIYASDGLSASAIEANLADFLPSLLHGLGEAGTKVGTPFFVKFGRVPAMDMISELLEAEVTCVLIGERPGLACWNSMSAYIAYRARVGMPEARRTVVSNIHAGGIPPVEAGAYVAKVLGTILAEKASGVKLAKGGDK